MAKYPPSANKPGRYNYNSKNKVDVVKKAGYEKLSKPTSKKPWNWGTDVNRGIHG